MEEKSKELASYRRRVATPPVDLCYNNRVLEAKIRKLLSKIRP